MNTNGQYSSQFERITPEKAQLWLDSIYEHQRPLRSKWVNYLAREMEKERFLPTSNIHFVFFDNKSHLINGQHTLHAIIKSGIAQSLPVVRTTAKTDEELAQFYFRYDQSIKRTFSDAVRALCMPEITHISSDKLNRLSSAVIWIGSDFGTHRKALGMRVPIDDLVRETIAWADDYLKLEEAITPCSHEARGGIMRRAVLAVALITFRNKPAHALDFWRGVARDDGLRYGDPRKTLNKWLLSHTADGGGNQAGVDAPEMSRVVERAWNAYIEGKNLQTIIVKRPNAELKLKNCVIPEVFAEIKAD